MSERLDQASSASTGLSVPWFFRSGWRLFGTLALTLAVLMGALTTLVVAQARRSLEDQAVRQNTLVTRLVAWAVEAQFEGLTRYVDSFTRRPLVVRAVESRDTEGARLHLRELVTRNPRLDRAFVTDARGTLWSDYPHAPEVTGQNFSHRDWYRGVSATKTLYVSEIYQRAAPPKPYLVALAVPIRNARQETIGYLVAQHTIEALTTWLAEVKPSPAGSVALVDHRGGLATTPNPGADGPHSLSQHPLVQRALAGESGSAVASDPLTGEKSLISYTAVPAIGWAVLSRQPIRVVFGPATALQRTIGILSLTFFAIMLGLGFVWLNTVRRHQRALFESNNAKDRFTAELDRTIADRTRAQEALRTAYAQVETTNREIQAANKELEAFSYSVSHDLRAPLRGVDGFSRILLEEHAPGLPADAQRYLGQIRDNIRQMGRLIDDLLAFSRLSRQPLKLQRVALVDVAQEVLDGLQDQWEGRRVEFKLGELPVWRADPALLRQVFVNLLSNALKFTRTREVARIEVGSASAIGDPQSAACFVRDNGVGFDMRYADKLFGVFQRLHRAEEYEGTGVGLAIVQRIVHRHGGRVWAEAEPDKGATFYFTLGGGESDG